MKAKIEIKRVHSAAVEVKTSSENGALRAIVAHVNRVDFSHDVVLPGATAATNVVMTPWDHTSRMGHLPPGRGRVYEKGPHILFDAEYFDTIAGQETRKTTIGLRELAEYSVEYRVTKLGSLTPEWKRLGAERVIEKWEIIAVANVLEGAMPDTSTIEIKCDGCCASSRSTVAPTREEVAALNRISRAIRARDAGMRERDASYYWRACAIAEFATKRLQPLLPPPLVRLFDSDGSSTGKFDPSEPDSIHIARGLRERDLILACVHESDHYVTWPRCSEQSAALAEKLLAPCWSALHHD